MTDAEEENAKQITEEATDNENSSGDSGIQINQTEDDVEQDDETQEKCVNDEETEDICEEPEDVCGEQEDTDGNPEDTDITDAPKVDPAINNHLEEDAVVICEEPEDVCGEQEDTDGNPEDTDMTDAPKVDPAINNHLEEDAVVTDSTTNYTELKGAEKDIANIATEKNRFKSNNNLVTLDYLASQSDRDSPEIVVEPKFVERFPSGKITPISIRAVTPVYRSVPVALKPPSRSVQTSKKRSTLKTLKNFMLFLVFTTIVVGYVIGGAYLFSHLERKREIEYNAKIDKWKNDTAILLATELRQVKPHEEVWARKVFHYLEVFEKDLLKASAVGYRRQDHIDRDQRWTWTSSFFFSVSLMTTTGYGPMTPRSKLGRIAAVLYSFFGIPLAFSWFMAIGYTLATFWISLFRNVCCRLCHEKPPQNLPDSSNRKPQKLPKVRTNSVVPIDEQKLLDQIEKRLHHSAKFRQNMFPDVSHSELIGRNNNHLKKNDFRTVEMKFPETQEVYHTMDYAVSIIYAFLLFVAYYVFFAIFFAVYEKWILTDILYISYLIFMTLGPGCHELDDDGAEIKIKNNVLYTVHLCIGYCILAMILNLIYMMLHGKCKSEELQKPVVFDSFHHEKF